MQLNKEHIKKFFDELIAKGMISKDDILFDDDELFNLNVDDNEWSIHFKN